MLTASDRITRAAKRQKKDYASLARATGLPRSYVSMVASGKRRLSVAAALSLGRELGIAPRALLVAQVDTDLAEAATP